MKTIIFCSLKCLSFTLSDLIGKVEIITKVKINQMCWAWQEAAQKSELDLWIVLQFSSQEISICRSVPQSAEARICKTCVRMWLNLSQEASYFWSCSSKYSQPSWLPLVTTTTTKYWTMKLTLDFFSLKDVHYTKTCDAYNAFRSFEELCSI